MISSKHIPVGMAVLMIFVVCCLGITADENNDMLKTLVIYTKSWIKNEVELNGYFIRSRNKQRSLKFAAERMTNAKVSYNSASEFENHKKLTELLTGII